MQRIATHTPWYRRSPLGWLGARCHITPLSAVDARTLADLGVHASELGSIDAESRDSGLTRTRRRIVDAGC